MQFLSSIGVIGGADGPTAIFVGGGGDYVSLAVVAAVVIGLTVIAFKRKKK